jgi:undecaprenyl-diphosphatase
MFIKIILSIIQALTEFLPVSSSAHLALVPWLFNYQDPGLIFDVSLHLGSTLALIIFFAKDWYKMLLNKDKTLIYIALATIPALIAGFFFKDKIDVYFHQSSYFILIIAFNLIWVGLLMIVLGSKEDKNRSENNIKKSMVIGLAQAAALIPGISRSGATMLSAQSLGLSREKAARFSFLLATPISLIASLSGVKDSFGSGINMTEILIPIIITFALSLIVIKYFLALIKRSGLTPYGYYRIVLGIIMIILFYIKR